MAGRVNDRLNKQYFKWLTNIVCGERYSKEVSYDFLLSYLHSVEFTYILPKDRNRAEDGIDLRYRFAVSKGNPSLCDYIIGPCSVLEMMVALALRCEEHIMEDESLGDRTGQWFWGMIVSLGLGSMTDRRYDENYVDYVITKFLNRDYEPNGRGGLFTIDNCKYDLRDIEIWYQLSCYLEKFT